MRLRVYAYTQLEEKSTWVALESMFSIAQRGCGIAIGKTYHIRRCLKGVQGTPLFWILTSLGLEKKDTGYSVSEKKLLDRLVSRNIP